MATFTVSQVNTSIGRFARLQWTWDTITYLTAMWVDDGAGGGERWIGDAGGIEDGGEPTNEFLWPIPDTAVGGDTFDFHIELLSSTQPYAEQFFAGFQLDVPDGTVTVSVDPDAEIMASSVDVVVRWLKAQPEIQAIVGTRVSTSLPLEEEDTTYPWLTVSRVIGVATLEEAALDAARFQFNAWGGTKPSGAPKWSEADLLIRTVDKLIRSTNWVRVAGHGIIMSMAGLEGTQQLKDPDTNGARFWMDARMAIRSDG